MNARSTLAHDLRGPLITVEGFAGELDEALRELEGLIAEGAEAAAVVERLTALLGDDLRPCLGFVTSAARTMHERIDALDTPSGGASDG